MSGSIEGQMLDQRDGQPIEGASLEARGEGIDKRPRGSASGDFQLAVLAAGSSDLVARGSGSENGLDGPLVVLDDVPTEL